MECHGIESVRKRSGVLDLAHRGLRRRIKLREAPLQPGILTQLHRVVSQRLEHDLAQLLDAFPPTPINHHHRDRRGLGERCGINRLALIKGHVGLRQGDDEAIRLLR